MVVYVQRDRCWRDSSAVHYSPWTCHSRRWWKHQTVCCNNRSHHSSLLTILTQQCSCMNCTVVRYICVGLFLKRDSYPNYVFLSVGRVRKRTKRLHRVVYLFTPSWIVGSHLPTHTDDQAELINFPQQQLNPGTVAHPSTDRVRRRATTLIETNALPVAKQPSMLVCRWFFKLIALWCLFSE